MSRYPPREGADARSALGRGGEASETHNQKNVRRSVAESLIGARDVVELAHGARIEAEAIVSTAFGCPYEGDVAPERVAQLAGHLIDAGADPNAALPGGETPLMTAARTGKAEAVKALLAHGAKVDAREQTRGQTALMWAAAEGNAAPSRS